MRTAALTLAAAAVILVSLERAGHT